MRAAVAEAAVAAGARLVNDVSGGLADPAMPRVVAAAGVPYVVMHWRGHSDDMDSRAVYDDVVAEVRDELRPAGRRACWPRGSTEDQIVLDPGLGFAKNAAPQLDAARPPRRAWPSWAIRCSSALRRKRSSAGCSPTPRARRARSAK